MEPFTDNWDLIINKCTYIAFHSDSEKTYDETLWLIKSHVAEMIEDDQLIRNLRQFNFTLAIGEL